MTTSMYYGAKKETFQFAAYLRKHLTKAEEILWEQLRNNNFNVRFKCQHPVSKYVVDFYCHPVRLVIEVDGSIQLLEEIHEKDIYREDNLRSLGLEIIRFTNEIVIDDLEFVRNEILDIMTRLKKTAPNFHDLGYHEDQ